QASAAIFVQCRALHPDLRRAQVGRARPLVHSRGPPGPTPMNAWQTIAGAALAYLLGSVSFAWILAWKVAGVDLRTFGSGNLGATNAGRLLGRKYAVAIYFLDFAKGFAPVVILRRGVGGPAPPTQRRRARH